MSKNNKEKKQMKKAQQHGQASSNNQDTSSKNDKRPKEINTEMEENNGKTQNNVMMLSDYKWHVSTAIICVIVFIGGLLWWTPWNTGVIIEEKTDGDSTNVVQSQPEVIKNKDGAGIYFKYSTQIDKKSLQFKTLKDSMQFKAAEGELLEFSTTKDEVKKRPQFSLGEYTLHPEFGSSYPKDSVNISVKGHEAIVPTILTLNGDTLMIAFTNETKANEVVIYPKFGNTPIDTIRNLNEVTSIKIDTAKIQCDTLRIAAKDHISALVKTVFYKKSPILEPEENKATNSIWAVLLTFAGIIGLIVDVIWIYRKYKRLQDNIVESDAKIGTGNSNDDEISRIENEIDSTRTEIRTKKTEIEGLNREIAELERLIPTKEASKETAKIEKEGESSENTETPDHKPDTYEEMSEWYKNEIYEKKWYQDDNELSSLIKTLDDYLIKEKDSFRGFLKVNFEKLYTAWKRANASSATGVTTTDIISSTSTDTSENTEEISVEQELREKKEKLKVEKENLNIIETNLLNLEKELSKLQEASDKKQEETIQDLKNQIKELSNKNEDLEQYKQSSEKKINNAQNEADRKVKIAEEKAQREINKANSRADEAEEKVKTIEKEVTNKFKGQIEQKDKTINEQKGTINGLESDLRQTKSDLSKTQSDLKFANETIEAKEKALERFSKTITDIAPAKSYAENLESLLNIAYNIEKTGAQLGQNPNIDDYLINKYIARYRASISGIDMMMFTTDVLNTTKAQFVYKTQMLATFDQKDKATFHESMKMYFFNTYLKKFIDALVVLNETMIGMQYLVDGVSAKDVSVFEKYRKEISDVLGKLEIEVINVKIMESCEDNLMLTVIPKALDFQCEKNSICQMDNCIVYLKGGNKPNEKIKVIVQK